MSIIKAFIYTILAFIFWAVIQLAILLPFKYFTGKPDDFTHIVGITKIISKVGAFLLIYFFFWRVNFNLKKAFSIHNYNPQIYLYLPVIGVGVFFLNRPLWDFCELIGFYQGTSSVNTQVTTKINIALIYNLFSTLLIAPIIEELFYRRFLLDELLKKNSQVLSIIISSLCFSMMHIETLNNLVPSFISGIIIGTIYLKTKKIGYCITLHFFINLILSVTNYFGTSWLTGYNFDILYWLLFGIGILLTLVGIKKITTANNI